VVEGNSYRNVVVAMEEENDKYVGRSMWWRETVIEMW